MLLNLINEIVSSDDHLPNVTWYKDSNNKLTLNIPIGYKYCNECDLFTPHEESEINYVCTVCENIKYKDSIICDNCTYEFNYLNDELSTPKSYLTKLHNEGCHFYKIIKGKAPLFIHDLNFRKSVCFDLDSHANILLRSFIKSLNDNDLDRLQYRIEEESILECGCPTVIVLNKNNIVTYSEYAGHSYDCPNPIEWEYEVRCPICGEVSEFFDSNC